MVVRKTMLALLATAAVALAVPTAASARGGFHGGGFHGGWHGGGWRGPAFGALGFGVGLGLAAPYAYGGYYGPRYGYGGYPYGGYAGYYPEGGCYLVNRRISTPGGWRLRRVEVCD